MHHLKLILLSLLLSSSLFSSNVEIYENQTRKLAEELRCMVCQNQSLLESDSELANDLKSLIKEKFIMGESKEDIKKFLVERYGEFILFKPEVSKTNIILWLSPLIILSAFIFMALRKMKIKYKEK
tara:strand:+ start:55 stop:432 length:378 start_codon:yes stop_codon:yes gene_type:complete